MAKVTPVKFEPWGNFGQAKFAPWGKFGHANVAPNYLFFNQHSFSNAVMVRNYQKKKPGCRGYVTYSEEVLEQCLEAIRSGKLSIRKAAQEFKIPRSTIQNKLKGAHSGAIGRGCVFSEEEEKIFTSRIDLLTDWGFPIDFQDLRY